MWDRIKSDDMDYVQEIVSWHSDKSKISFSCRTVKGHIVELMAHTSSFRLRGVTVYNPCQWKPHV